MFWATASLLQRTTPDTQRRLVPRAPISALAYIVVAYIPTAYGRSALFLVCSYVGNLKKGSVREKELSEIFNSHCSPTAGTADTNAVVQVPKTKFFFLSVLEAAARKSRCEERASSPRRLQSDMLAAALCPVHRGAASTLAAPTTVLPSGINS